ncbi:FAD-dependent monooxygenase [Subtercola sp. YIM 133946]|uniref:FAD-dependent monooxygenase n=1 Tax=Subtercola sp. YIM 133946 TaxID=3118909 RepID=UPI002F92322F
MRECEVVVVGAGPVGMVLAGELALAGVTVMLLERRPSQALVGSRAGGLQARTIEEFDQRGIADRFLAAGTTAQVQRFGEVTLDISDFPTRHPYGLGLWQNRIETILAEWIGELGVTPQYGCEVVGVDQDEAGVTVRVAGGHPAAGGAGGGPATMGRAGDGLAAAGGAGHEITGSASASDKTTGSASASDKSTIRAQYVVGCDGGRSVVRRAAGIGFEGWDATVSNLVAEVEYGVEPEWGMRRHGDGSHGIGRIGGDSETIRVVVTESELKQGAAEPTLGDLSAAMTAVWGTDFGVHSPTWISRFTDAARQAGAYRVGRILIAGDAAHVHYPAGGQGLNIGVQDATNVGWKLAQVVRGISPAALLDTYEAERRPVAAQVLRDTLAQVGLRRSDERSVAVAEAVSELLSLDAARRRFGARLSGLGVRYDFGGGAGPADGGAAGWVGDGRGEHPLVGRRMPDLPLLVEGDAVQTFELLHEARPVLLDFKATVPDDAVLPWADRVRTVQARYDGVWELPEVGVVDAPSGVLIRPDGYVAWVGSETSAGLRPALERWFSPA